MLTGHTQRAATVRPKAVPVFVDEVFASLQRVDQRRWAQAYLNGLLNVRGRKTLQSLAKAGAHSAASAHGLQQFINSSPWDWSAVRQALAGTLAAHARPRAWSVAEVTIPKRGEHSVGVRRRFDQDAGRVINCQQGLALFMATDTYSVPVDWRILLDETWCDDEVRRRRARIPASVTAVPDWAHVLHFAANVSAHPRLRRIPWVMDLRRTTNTARVTRDLTRHHQDFVCEVSPGHPVMAAQAGLRMFTAAEFVAAGQARQEHLVAAQRPTGRVEQLLLHSGLVRISSEGGIEGAAALPVHRLVVRPASRAHRTARYWITNLVDRRVDQILSLAQSVRTTDSAVSELELDFGILDFEGRSFPGWHHHMTMASVAYAYSRLYPEGSGQDLRVRRAPERHLQPMRLIS
ncbi:IS701 family transposase [Streptomyces sp. NPDC054871]